LIAWSYEQKWALVTGASAGIGQEFAEQLAARGSRLILSARRLERLEDLARTLNDRYGVECVAIASDLSLPGAAERLWSEASASRTIELLVNNAGFGAQGRFDEVPLERHREMLQVNCTALLELAHLAICDMRPRAAGGIINVSSIAAFQPVPQLASYAASKAFVLNLSEALWAENQEVGIRVLALCPGRTPTEFQQVAGTGTAEGAFGYRTPAQVVTETLEALEAGKSYVVPGFENLAASWVVRALPRSTVVKVLKRLVKRAVGTK
jgi:short-subunit dehydrogenase